MTAQTAARPSNAEAIVQQRQANAVATFKAPRLPYHPAIEERFGIDQASWKALVEAVFPLATSIDSVILALSYCRARKLDPFKRVVYIVPIWSKADGKMIDTVWPGIGELRTTAFRTGLYAGRDDAEFGPEITEKVGNVEVTFPEWCKVTVYRVCGGERRAFAGPKVYWMETYATRSRTDQSPNEMWGKRTRGQLEKCAEAAALRAAFPEELGDELTNEEAPGLLGRGPEDAKDITPRPTRVDFSHEATEAPHDAQTGEVIESGTAEPSPAEVPPMISAATSIQMLMELWAGLPPEITDDEGVQTAYESKRDELAAQAE